MGEDKMKGEINLVETKFKAKIEKLNKKIKIEEDEKNKFKLKSLGHQNQRTFRLDLEKSLVKVKKLEDKIKKLEHN